MVASIVLSPSSARKNASSTVTNGPNRRAFETLASSSESPRSVQAPNPTNARPAASVSQNVGSISPSASPIATDTRWTSSVATKMPASTSRGLKRVAKASATSWDLPPISASAMKKSDCQNATMSSVLQTRAWAEVGYEKTLDPPDLARSRGSRNRTSGRRSGWARDASRRLNQGHPQYVGSAHGPYPYEQESRQLLPFGAQFRVYHTVRHRGTVRTMRQGDRMIAQARTPRRIERGEVSPRAALGRGGGGGGGGGGDAVDAGEGPRGLIGADATGVLVGGEGEHPVEAVLDAPPA